MTKMTAVFCDVGGVFLTNAWDRHARDRAAEKFQLDRKEFEERHQSIVEPFETGQATLDDYLERAVFYRSRNFKKEEFRDFMFAQSQAFPETLNILARLAGSRRCLLAAVNNESLDVNAYRIRRFRLRDYFEVFFSSCFVGVRKPDEAIYRLAMRLTQRAPEESAFIDDREENIEGARRCGMHVIRYRDPNQLRRELGNLGIET